MIAQLVADSGLPRMMIREIAKDPDCAGSITGAAQGLIWAISVVVCLLVAVIALFLPYGNDVKLAVLLMTGATLATFHSAGYSAVLRAFEDNELNYAGLILQKVLLLGFILAMLHFRTGLIGFVIAHLISNLLLWFFYHVLVSRLYTKVKLRVDWPLWKELFLSAIPMGGGVMLRSLAMQIDIFVLGLMTNMNTVGLFGGPYRLSWTLRTVPQTLALPLYPLYSRTAHLSPERFRQAYQQSIKFFALVSIPFAAFFVAWSAPILHLRAGQQVHSRRCPRCAILVSASFPSFFPRSSSISSPRSTSRNVFFTAHLLGPLLRVGMLIFLIPRLGLVGPAIAFTCAETLIVGMWIVQLSRLGYSAKLGEVFFRPLIAGVCMAAVLFAAKDAPLIWQLGGAILAAVVYVVALLALRTFSAEEVQQAREGISFVSPFIESWSKKLKRNT